MNEFDQSMKFIDDMRKLKTNNIRHKYFEEIPLSSSESLDHANILANKFIIEKSYLKIYFFIADNRRVN